MTRVAAVAYAYSLPIAEVERWPEPVVDAFHRHAVHRGWLHEAAA